MILIFREFHFFSRAKRGSSSSIHACASIICMDCISGFSKFIDIVSKLFSTRGYLKTYLTRLISVENTILHQSTRTCQKTCLSEFPYTRYIRNKKINENKLVGGTTTWSTIWGPVHNH